MEVYDDELRKFEADGAAPLPVTNDQGYVEHAGARVWYSAYGSGPTVILLHGGLGNSGNWSFPQRGRLADVDRGVSHGLESGSQTLRVDRDRRIHPEKAHSLSSNLGA